MHIQKDLILVQFTRKKPSAKLWTKRRCKKKQLLLLRHVRHGWILCKYMHNTSPTSAHSWNHQEAKITLLSKVKKRARFESLEMQNLHSHTSTLTFRIQAGFKETDISEDRERQVKHPKIGHETPAISCLENVPN